MKKLNWVIPGIIVLEAVIILYLSKGSVDKKILALAVLLTLGAFVALCARILSPAPYLKRLQVTLIIALTFGLFGNLIGDADISATTSHSKKCAYCNRSFTGKGYYHIGSGCEQESGNGWEGNHCSIKCCKEDWDNNGIKSR